MMTFIYTIYFLLTVFCIVKVKVVSGALVSLGECVQVIL